MQLQGSEMAAVKEVQPIAMLFMKEEVIVMRVAIELLIAVQIYSL